MNKSGLEEAEHRELLTICATSLTFVNYDWHVLLVPVVLEARDRSHTWLSAHMPVLAAQPRRTALLPVEYKVISASLGAAARTTSIHRSGFLQSRYLTSKP